MQKEEADVTSKRLFLLSIASAYKNGVGVAVYYEVEGYPRNIITVYTVPNLEQLVQEVYDTYDEKLISHDGKIRISRYGELQGRGDIDL